MASIDSTKLYTISTTVSGQRMVLSSATENDTVIIEPEIPGAEKRQQWQISQSEFIEFFHLSTVHQTRNGRSLDVFDTNSTESRDPWFAKTGYYTGQFWRLDSSINGTYRLSNNFTGPDRHLQCFPNAQLPELGSGDSPTQYWTLTDVKTNDFRTTTRTPDVPVSAPSSATTTDLAEDPYGLAPEANGKLSAAGIVGVAVGGAVVLALALGVGFVVLVSFRRTKKTKRPQRPAAPFRERSYTAKWHAEELPMPRFEPTLGPDDSAGNDTANSKHHQDSSQMHMA